MNAGERLPGTPEPTHVQLTADGLRIAFDTWGDPDAPMVLFGHGGGQTRHAWTSTAQRFAAAGYWAVAFDLPGHSDSDWMPDGDYSFEARLRHLESFVQLLSKPRPVLIGASLSAETFLLAAGERRIDAAALVLADFAPRTMDEGFERNRAFMRAHAAGFASLQEVADAITQHRGTTRPLRHDGLAKVVRRGRDGRYHWHWDPRLLDWRTKEFPLRHARMVAASRELAVPTLLVRGEHSDVLSEDGAQEFLRLAPHAHYSVLQGAGHMVAGDRNDAFGDAALALLRNVPAAGS
ncbi:alpha/beta fold hydrolase [Azohydromonas australica]|uniref:alpha/beta fold hydrolase n=1 Tax=Azohydromonas australica TaxID=364039 RepID=UPI0004147231|nr:alpha/beta hydrolase [Azohydromonas australica]